LYPKFKKIRGATFQYAAWLGDRRVLPLAEKYISKYEKAWIKYTKNSTLQEVAFALNSFKSKDDTLQNKAKVLLNRIINNSSTPQYIKDKIKNP